MSPSHAIGALVARNAWAMMPGERAALDGVLAILEPLLSIEIGTWRGGSLDRISHHSAVVHAFDLVQQPDVTSERFPNVTFHIGDNHKLLPAFLARLASAGENVDFAFVDGDHSARGARQDLEDLLSSPSVGRTVILLHDTLHERVRAGLDEIDYDHFDKVRFVDLDFVQGRVMCEGPQENELWYGLGLVVTGWELEDAAWARAYAAPKVYESFGEALVRTGRVTQRLGYDQFVELELELEEQRNLVKVMEGSLSWRLTAPLRGTRSLARRGAARLR